MNSINGPNWYSLKRSAHFKEWRVKPLAKLLSKIGFVQAISDEHSQIHYVSKAAFKKWASRWNIEAKNEVLSLGFLCDEAHVQNLVKKLDARLIKEKIAKFNFHGEVTPEEQQKIEAFMVRHLLSHSKPGDQRYFCAGPQLPRGFRAEWDQYGDLARVTLFGIGKSDLDAQSVDLFRTMQGSNRPARTMDSYIHWPKNVKREIGITPKQQLDVDNYIRTNFETLKRVGAEAKRLKGKDTGLPISLLLVPDEQGQLKKIILIPDTSKVGIVGFGGQRMVKSAFDLTEGHRLVRKKVSSTEQRALESMQQSPQSSETVALRKKKIGHLEVDQQFEMREDGTLEDLLWVPMTSVEQVNMAKGLLAQLKEFHEKKTEDNVPAFHSDIKPKNILFRASPQGGYELTISDFGIANIVEGVAGSFSNSAPEHLRALFRAQVVQNYPISSGVERHNREYGQANDAWGMGIVLFAIVTQGQTLPYIYQTITEWGSGTKESWEHLSQVKQDTVDRNIRAMKNRYSPESPLWPVIQQLLQVDPQVRITAAKALELLE